MKLQYASDLHLEFGENTTWLKHFPLIPEGEVLVLCGDIGYIGDNNYSRHPFWDFVSESFREVIVIPGNHEFYKFSDINNFHAGWQMDIRPNVRAVYNQVIPLTKKTDLISTTLWSHIERDDAYKTERSVSDFRRILNGDELLDSARFNAEHRRCLAFLSTELGKRQEKQVVVATHHVPSFQLVAPEFQGSRINGAFTVELADFITAHPQIHYWIYGHSHRNINRQIGSTRCVSNQLGYVFANEDHSFNRKAVIEVE
ncbi:MAG: metallophosphoesterase [Bacteroidales bacterium]|nr:metallophosphoesterase [Bacteroidales bacterium]